MQEQEASKLRQRYQFHSALGHGGTGEVFSAWDDHLKRTVAIKRMKTTGLDDAILADPWQEEAIRMAAIRHANIISVYDMGQDNGVPYIVMEHVQGQTVEERATERVFALEEFGELARQSLDGLVAAHHVGLIHRDLKPSNIMLSELPSGAFCVKILDFGMAKFMEAPAAQTLNIDGTITGSICWISPEQLNRQPVDSRSDLYSLGCVLYFALTAKRPFDGETVRDTITAHLSHNVVPLESLRPDLPPIVNQWVMSLINLRPEHRYDDSKQALASLNGILLSLAHTSPLATVADITPPVAPPSFDLHTGHIVQSATTGSIRPSERLPMELESTPQAPAPASRVHSSSWPGVAALLLSLLLSGTAAWYFFKASNVPTVPAVAAPAAPLPAAPIPAAVVPDPAPVPAAPAPVAPPVVKPAVIEPAVGAPSPAPAETRAVAEVPADVIFRIRGSNTIGAKLLPALMEEFLKREGGTQIVRKPGATVEEVSLEAVLPGDRAPKAIEIAAHGSSTAFSELLAGTTDLGMSSRPVKAEEAEAFLAKELGDPRSAAFEHVLGLDGIAIVVNRGNPISSLTKDQIAQIFSGAITDWSQVGGEPNPIHLYARDAKSGTFDTFKSLVLGKTEIAAEARRFEDSNELSDLVAADTLGIGFIGLPFIRESKPLAVSEPGASPLIATRFTVATEDYLLSRRLFLYTAAKNQNPMMRRFVEFALSDAGQDVVQKVGFVKLTPDVQGVQSPPNAPAEYVQATTGAKRLSLNFRFRKGGMQLDNRGLRDIHRITDLLGRYTGSTLMLMGFADGIGSPKLNLKLSQERAEAIAHEFRIRGVTVSLVAGFGSALPVASNESENGREKNRRVEIWLNR